MQSSYKDVQGQKPVVAFVTSKSADEYMGCMMPRAVEIWPTASTMRDGNSWVIRIFENQDLAAVTIAPRANGASVELREWTGLTIIRTRFQRMREAVEACR